MLCIVISMRNIHFALTAVDTGCSSVCTQTADVAVFIIITGPAQHYYSSDADTHYALLLLFQIQQHRKGSFLLLDVH